MSSTPLVLRAEGGAQSITTAGQKVSNNSVSINATYFSGSAGSWLCATTGLYHIHANVSHTGGANNNFQVGIYLNATLIGSSSVYTTSQQNGASTARSFVAETITRIVAGDILELRYLGTFATFNCEANRLWVHFLNVV